MLYEDTRDITAYTCQKIFLYTRLMFGIELVAEIYQHDAEHVLQEITCVCSISDDIIISANSSTEILHKIELRV